MATGSGQDDGHGDARGLEHPQQGATTAANARFSDVVLVVCPNVTIRNRLRELDPAARRGQPLPHARPRAAAPDAATCGKGRVLVTNWHVFEPQAMQAGGVSREGHQGGRAASASGRPITIGAEDDDGAGEALPDAGGARRGRSPPGSLEVIERGARRAGQPAEGRTSSPSVTSRATPPWSTACSAARSAASRTSSSSTTRRTTPTASASRSRTTDEEELFGEEEEAEEFFKEATVWVDGLDRIHKLRGINFCVDLSATPYFLGRVGQDTNRPFPWVVSDFGLTDAIESGLVKIPQLAVRDTTGAEIPGYFNIWRWILPKLTPAERGGKKGAARSPRRSSSGPTRRSRCSAGSGRSCGSEWAKAKDEPRPPVFILVCKNTAIAKVVYEWLAREQAAERASRRPNIEGFRNADGRINTIRVDSKVVHETDTGAGRRATKSRWMRFTLDTVGKTRLAARPAGAAALPRGLRGAGEEARATRFIRPGATCAAS